MKTGDKTLDIPKEVILGFSNCGKGWYSALRFANKEKLVSGLVKYPYNRLPENSKEQLKHFLFLLRVTMSYLAEHPIGKQRTLNPALVAKMLTELPKRAAYVRSGDTTGVIYTDNTIPLVDSNELRKRFYFIREQTREKYCRAIRETPIESNSTKLELKPKVSRWEVVK
jgi:hypothetical protein